MRRTTVVLALLLLAGGCGSGAGGPTGGIKTGGERPAWIDKPSSDPRFPIERFITAIAAANVKGMTDADALAKLDAAARAAVATSVAGQIKATLTDYDKAESKNGVKSSEKLLEQRIEQSVRDFDLTNVSIEERWADATGTAYGFAVLEKQKAVLLETPKLTDLAKSAAEHIGRGDGLADKDPGAALGEYFRARVAAEKAWGGKALVRALGGDASSIPSPAEAEEKLATLIGKVALAIDSGGEQRVTDGKPLPRPVVVAATAGGAPVGGIPLVVEMRGARLETKASTGPDGKAAIRVDDVGKFDTPEKPISVAVDWGALAGGAAPAWASSLRSLSATTTAQKRTKESVRVIVKIQEQIMMGESGGNPAAVSEPPVTNAITRALEEAGLKPKDAKELDAKLADPAKATDTELKDKAVGLADLLFVGTATSRESGKYGSKTVWHRARAELRVVDLGTGKVLATFTDEAKAKKPGEPDWAGRSALEALAEKLGPVIAPKLLKELGF